MTESRDRFMHLLKDEILQLDQPELDFGIYRILNFRRVEIERFFDEELPAVLEAAIANEAVIDVEKRDEEGPFGESELDRLYNRLYVFFSRYFRDGDFEPQPRRARKARYSVPYNGEDVHFYWRSFGSHYVKTSEELRSYRFKSGKQAVRFELVDAYEEPDNVKGSTRYFLPMVESCELRTEPGGSVFVVPFAFHRLSGADERKYRAKSEETNGDGVQERVIADFGARVSLPDGVARSDVLKHLKRYTAKGRRDYFVYPNLGPFLREELDFYLKNEVLDLDGASSGEALTDHLKKARTLREVGGRIIDFLHDLETIQVRLFEKRRFVLRTDYLIPLWLIAAEQWPRLAENARQVARWRDDAELGGSVLAFMSQHPELIVETDLFDTGFCHELLGGVDRIDEYTCGFLVHGENFESLRTLGPRFRNEIDVSYIDPPYNTGSDGFLYKDEMARHSSWLSMIVGRLRAVMPWLTADAPLYISIDDREVANLAQALRIVGLELNSTIAVKMSEVSGVENDPRGLAILEVEGIPAGRRRPRACLSGAQGSKDRGEAP